MSKKQPESKVTAGPPERIKLERTDYLEFENAWLKMNLASENLKNAQMQAERTRQNLIAKYRLQGDWRIAPERRELVAVKS